MFELAIFVLSLIALGESNGAATARDDAARAKDKHSKSLARIRDARKKRRKPSDSERPPESKSEIAIDTIGKPDIIGATDATIEHPSDSTEPAKETATNTEN